jgi:hypothetical protein
MFVLPHLEEITLDNFGVSGFLFGRTPKCTVVFLCNDAPKHMLQITNIVCFLFFGKDIVCFLGGIANLITDNLFLEKILLELFLNKSHKNTILYMHMVESTPPLILNNILII